MKRLVALLVLVGTLPALGVLATGATAAGEPAGGDRDARVLVISVPGLTWQDVDRNHDDIPHLAELLDRSGVGNVATRTISRRARVADGYATLNAGARAVGAGNTADGEAFGVDESFGIDTAGRVFERRTGEQVRDGIVSLSLAEILERNADERYDSEVGALGDALHAAGHPRAVIGNADGFDPPDPEGSGYRRTMAEGLMGSDGVVPAGRVDGDLLMSDPAAPFGVRLDNEEVAAAFSEVWESGAVVLVEASDLVREDVYRSVTSAEERPRFFRQALRATDDLVGRLLEHVDPSRDIVVVVGPSHPERQVRLTIAALAEPGTEPGLLRSGSTRRSGFVQLVDIAPTILDRLGVDAPDAMEGRPASVAERGGSAADRRQFLVAEDAASTFRDGNVGPVATLFVAVVLVIALGGMLTAVTHRGGQVLPRALFGGALGVLALVPAVYLARLAPFHDWGEVAYYAFLVGIAGALAGLYTLAGRGRPVDSLAVALGAIVAILVFDVILGTPLQFNSPMGYSPKVAGRFTGFGNLGYAALASSTVILAGLLTHRIGGRRGAGVAVTLLAVVFVVNGAPFWGANVGGVLSMLPAYAVTASLLLGGRVRVRTIAAYGLGAVAAVVVFGLIDLARPAAQRSHLGRLFESIADDGWSVLATVVTRKAGANLSALTNSVWMWMVPIALGLLIWLVWKAPDRLRQIDDRIPELRAAGVGFVVVAVLGYAFNDSGIVVPGIMLGVATSVLVALVVTTPSREPASPRP